MAPLLCENDDYASEVTSMLCSIIDTSLDTSTDSGMVASLDRRHLHDRGDDIRDGGHRRLYPYGDNGGIHTATAVTHS